jgi:GT2 family glycosyltransferase
MTTPPRLSIIVPTRGRPSALERCLAALGRTHSPPGGIEVVVVADGPDPRLEPVVSGSRVEGGPEVRLVSQKHAGPAAARNRGAAHACGELLAFTDDDCVPTSDWARQIVLALDRESNAIVGGPVVNALGDLPAARAAQVVVDVVQAHYRRGTGHGAFLTSNNLAISRDAFDALGGFDETSAGAAAEDRDLSERAVDAGYTIFHCPAVVEHSHHLTTATLWRQQYHYGRGARTLARVRAARGAPPLLPAPSLYGELVAAAWREGRTGPVSPSRMVSLVALTQIAYAAGLLVGDGQSPRSLLGR